MEIRNTRVVAEVVNVPMGESKKESMESYLEQVLKSDNEQLLNHFTGMVRTHEMDIVDGESSEYSRIIIDKLWEEVLKRMGK